MGLIRLFKHDLAMETRTWVEKQLISPDQAADICNIYGIDFHNMDRRSRGYRILVLLGCLFIGMSLITLASANWDEIPRAIRMGGLISITLAAHLAGIANTYRKGPATGIGFFFLGSLFYGAAIMLIAQIYHIGEHFPDGVLVWALGVLPLALLLKSTALMMLTLALAAVWFFLEIHLGYFPRLFPLFLAAVLWHLFRAGQSRILFMALVALAGFFFEYWISWTLGQDGHLDFDMENIFFAGGWCIACYGLSRFLAGQASPAAKDYGELLALWCLRFFIFLLVVFSFEANWEGMLPRVWQAPAMAISGGIFMSLAGFILVLKGQHQPPTLEIFSIVCLVFMGYLLAALVVTDPGTAFWFSVSANLILVATGVGLIVSGVRDAASHYFFLGVITILLTGLMRYIDLVGDYIGTAALFGVFAAILLVTARFWKTRQHKGRQP